MTKRLTDFKVLTFDCYGTLIDWETGIWDALQPLIMCNRRSDILREGALACFARQENALQSSVPGMHYRKILENVPRVADDRRQHLQEALVPLGHIVLTGCFLGRCDHWATSDS